MKKSLLQMMIVIFFLFFFLLGVFAITLFAPANASMTNKYDKYIKESCDRYLNDLIDDCLPWHKALLFTESRLNPSAKSQVGAMGLGQIMPGTWRENAPKVRGAISAYDARSSIRVSAFYLSKTIKFWSDRRHQTQRMWLGMAGYNAGNGNILKAQRICNNEQTFKHIKKCLHKVTGIHSQETINYVKRIKYSFCTIQAEAKESYWGISGSRNVCIGVLSYAIEQKQEKRHSVTKPPINVKKTTNNGLIASKQQTERCYLDLQEEHGSIKRIKHRIPKARKERSYRQKDPATTAQHTETA